jgi:hypothetical protein
MSESKPQTAIEATNAYAATVSTNGRVLVDMHVAGQVFTTVTAAIAAAFLAGWRAADEARATGDYTRDEALQAAEGPSSLRELVAYFHERGAVINEQSEALDAAWQDIQDWLQLARRQREASTDPNHAPNMPSEAGIAKSVRVCEQIGRTK